MLERLAPETSARWIGPLLLIVLIVVAYLPGLPGEFLLDDRENLLPVARAVQGDLDPWTAITSNRSGPLHRPVAMASFVANGLATGMNAGSFKAVNILLHIGTAMLIFGLVRRWVASTPTREYAGAIALWTALVWALSPISVSTVLYVVQRMTQLSALFVCVGLLAFTQARLSPGSRREVLLLFVAVPAALVAAALSKESGLLLPLLAFVVEITLFAALRPSRASRWFFALFLWLPAAIGIVAFAVRPEWLLAGYDMRGYGPGQRLATESVVLFHYLRDIVVPFGPGMGLIHDDVKPFASMLEPIAVVAMLFWIGLAGVALWFRRRWPLLAFGALFFLAGHALESTIVPLELYFEHRNYLPSIGVVLVLGCAFQALRARASSATVARAVSALALAYVAIVGFGTFARAHAWSSFDTLLAQEQRYGRPSQRLEAMLAARAMDRGDLATALAHVDRAEALMDPARRAVSDVWRLLAYCVTRETPPPELGAAAVARAPNPIALNGSVGFGQLVERQMAGSCPMVPWTWTADIGERWLAQSGEDPRTTYLWRIEYYQAIATAKAGRMERALDWAGRAFDHSRGDVAVGLLFAETLASLARYDEAARVLGELRAADRGDDKVISARIAEFERQLEAARSEAAPQP